MEPYVGSWEEQDQVLSKAVSVSCLGLSKSPSPASMGLMLSHEHHPGPGTWWCLLTGATSCDHDLVCSQHNWGPVSVF